MTRAAHLKMSVRRLDPARAHTARGVWIAVGHLRIVGRAVAIRHGRSSSSALGQFGHQTSKDLTREAESLGESHDAHLSSSP